MHVQPVKTPRLTAGQMPLRQLLDSSLTGLPENSVLAVTSKVVSLCEGAVVERPADKEALIRQEAEYYTDAARSAYGHHFTVKHHTVIAAAGIDASNAGDTYVLWPRQPQRTCDDIRQYLRERFGRRHIGVIITDSTSTPMRLGTTGIYLAHSGFRALRDYVGQPDLFGRPFDVSRANIAAGLAAAATLTMGEGAEQTPLAVLSDIPFVDFQDRKPIDQELNELHLTLQQDLFAPFFTAVPWHAGGSAGRPATDA